MTASRLQPPATRRSPPFAAAQIRNGGNLRKFPLQPDAAVLPCILRLTWSEQGQLKARLPHEAARKSDNSAWYCPGPEPPLAFLARGRTRERARIARALGVAASLKIALFPYIRCVAWLVVLPGWFWNRVMALAARWRGPAGDHDGIRSRRDWIAAPAKLARTDPPRSGWLVARPVSIRPSRLNTVLASVLCVYVLLWNLRTVSPQTWRILLPREAELAKLLHIEQKWEMFAPHPLTDDGWFVAPALLRDGSSVDLLSGGPARWDKPASVSSTFRNARWRSYLMRLRRQPNTLTRRATCATCAGIGASGTPATSGSNRPSYIS